MLSPQKSPSKTSMGRNLLLRCENSGDLRNRRSHRQPGVRPILSGNHPTRAELPARALISMDQIQFEWRQASGWHFSAVGSVGGAFTEINEERSRGRKDFYDFLK